jgi:2,3-bisphosphoglycerate-independent phosphoglycerate mutase
MLETDASKKFCVGKLYYPTDFVGEDGDASYEIMVLEEVDGKFVAKTLKSDAEFIMIIVAKAAPKTGYKVSSAKR